MSDVMTLLEDAGVEPQDGERNIMIKCPMAPYTGMHRNLRDSRPSMGVKCTDIGEHLVNCFTCGYRSPSLAKMFNDLYEKSRDGRWLSFVDRAVALEQLDLDGVLSLVSDLGTEVALTAQQQPSYDDGRYDLIEGQHDHWYWETRNIRPETAQRWRTGYDPERQRIVIPIFDQSGTLRGATGRTVSEVITPKYHNYWEMKKGYWLLGEHLIKGRALIVVEGPLDALVVDQHLGDLNLRDEYSVISLLGAKHTKRQINVMRRVASELVLFMDRDEAGREATDSIMRSLEGKMIVSRVKYGSLEYKDPGSMPLSVFNDVLQTADFL
jgi:5S rRNA maturation endonuclease (ribonuclease M5)